MKKILLFDTSYGTRNMGDFIINEAVMREMKFLFDEHFLVRFGTHNPLVKPYQTILPNSISRTCKEPEIKLLGGTNLFKPDLLRPNSDWSIDLRTSGLYAGSVSLGCGLGGKKPKKVNAYTRKIYDRALSHEYVHSVRDDATKEFLEELGFQAVNTGCPTLWGLTPEHTSQIPVNKSPNVIFTLTDYMPDIKNDQELINMLNDNYETVYFWVQGSRDFEYLNKFKGTENIVIVGPSLEAYKEVLVSGEVDYVGTRLHAGIFAMQHKIRSVILAVDNRARDMDQSHSLNVIERSEVSSLEDILNGEISTNVVIDLPLISTWKNQFILP